MYDDTINSLHLLDPITYLGFVKRDDMEIKIDNTPFESGERAEFKLPKYTDIVHAVRRANLTGKKTLHSRKSD